MGIYLNPVVALDDGPAFVFAPDVPGVYYPVYLAYMLSVTDIRTRAVFAHLHNHPRQVWWLADSHDMWEEIDATGKFGPRVWETGNLPSAIPASTLDYPIVINHDSGEYFDGRKFPSACLLPVLVATIGHHGLSDAWCDMRGDWIDDRISVHTVEDAPDDYRSMTEIYSPELAEFPFEPEFRDLCS